MKTERIISPTAQRLRPFGTTIFTEMTRLAIQHGAVNLAQGFPDFDGPEFVKEAAAKAMKDGHNQYARMFGLPVLNQAIAAAWQRDTGTTIDPDTQVTVTSGCTEAIAAAMLGVVNPGDEVILFEPYYDSYKASVAFAGGVARCVTLHSPSQRERVGGGPSNDQRHSFWFNPDDLRQAFTPKTRAILVNTPHNPTGKVFSRDELALIADLCIKHDVTAITDEVYERLICDPAQSPHLHLATFPGMAERTITLSSLGKTFSLTGWKIGWAIAPQPLTAAIRSAHQFLTFATATPLQIGAAAAISQGDSYIRDLVEQLRAARSYLGGALERLGFRVYWPAGTYFIMVDHTMFQMGDDVEFCRRLTSEIGVAAIPPSVFYDHPAHGRPLARFAFCKKMETLEKAVERLQRLRK